MKKSLLYYFEKIRKKLNLVLNSISQKPISQLPNILVTEPIFMIPGSSATEDRFNSLVKTLNKNSSKKHELIRIKVWKDYRITYKGQLKGGNKKPIFVVGFENNKDGYSHIKEQAKMFHEVFSTLYQQYHFYKFKGFAHSNGGLIYTCFLEQYFKNYSQIKMTKLMAVGSPYNFKQKSLETKEKMLKDFIQGQHFLPTNLDYVSIIGNFWNDGDGLVPRSSVEAGRLIYKDRVASYKEYNITGKNSSHSALLKHPQVIDLIQNFLFQE
ncbi:MAG: alpha/beta hydrolase [Streptococcus sp.]|nr:alpha/beta hydrolase [Streptococcus sp.]